MKVTTKLSILMLTACAFMMVGVFGKPLGIPSDFESIPILVAIIFIYFHSRVRKKAKAAGRIPTASESQKRKLFVLAVALCALVCVTAPFVLPSTGVTLPFAEQVIISVVTFFICVLAIWFGMKSRT